MVSIKRLGVLIGNSYVPVVRRLWELVVNALMDLGREFRRCSGKEREIEVQI